MSPTAGGFLEKILERKRSEIAQLQQSEARRRIDLALQQAPAVRDFPGSLVGAGLRVIAEVKRASPSRGRLVESYDPAGRARAYEAGGAAALSVLTDAEHFEGHLDHLAAAARAAAALPVLRKDFILEACQVDESRGAGADAILLIAAALPGAQLRRLLDKARGLGMEALVEVHDAAELDRALESGARIVGVNNRNLRTFEVDLEVSLRLAPRFPAGILRVSESGIASRQDLRRLREAGYQAFLIGEALARASDPAAQLREWIR